MMWCLVRPALCGLVLLMCAYYSCGTLNTVQKMEQGYRLEPDPTYLIVAPRKIYPSQVLQVSVTIFRLYYQHLNVRASIRKDGEEFASLLETFVMPSMRQMQMQMPDNARPGNYTLRIEGTLNGGMSGNIFENETKLVFDTKQCSMFITTNKPVYMQGQEVNFRIVPVKPNLLPAHGSMDVYVLDPTGTVMRRWLAMQTNLGLLDMAMHLSDQPRYGIWKIRVNGFGHIYEKEFEVEEFYLPRFYVNVSMPMYELEDSYAIAGVITANHTSGRPARGNGEITIEIRPPYKKIDQSLKDVKYPTIHRELHFFEGMTDFLIPMAELTEINDDTRPVEKEIHVSVRVFDWFLMENQTGFSICIIHSHRVEMKLLGDPSRTFKPGYPITVYYAVVNSDGSPLHGDRRQVTITRTVRGRSQQSFQPHEESKVVPDNGIVGYTFIPHKDSELIKITAYYDTAETGTTKLECVMSRFHTFNNEYLSITTSTEQPMVNHYMIFTLRTSILVDRIWYLIIAGGNIVVGNHVDMDSRQKTFGIALSRDMVPSARILAYFVYNSEIIADSLNFFVNGTRINKVDVLMNMGKDFSRDTVEMSGRTDPGAFIAFSGVDYDWYSHGADIFLREKDIIEELESYDSFANLSYHHTWYYGEEHYEKVYYPAPTYGVDSNATFMYAGLVVFTDANLTKFIHFCNETLGDLPCNDGLCYRIEQRCDGERQCEDGIDEMGCPREEDDDPYTPAIHRFKHLPSHFVEDGSWMWTSTFVKHDGRIDLKRHVPKEPKSWLVGALAVSRDLGLGVVVEPARYQSTRQFYIRVEMPTHARKGEQIGVRIALFNYWHVDQECLVTLHDSDEYRFVIVERNGIISSYKPRTARGDVQTMVLVQKGQMMTIHMPVLPIVDGDLDVTVSATSFMGQDKVTKKLNVRFDGVTNYYNTPYLVDLINQGSRIIPDFEVPVPERFIEPSQREHLYVPGSPNATVSIVGDMVGPGFYKPFLDAENFMRKPYGAGEMNMFNYAINLYYLKYLKTTNQLKDSVLHKALDYMNLGMQRQMSYMNNDGSFNMFRDYRDPKPSTWLSAVALQAFQASDEADWHLMFYLPPDLLNKIASFLTTQQDETTGVFNEQAPIYDRKMLANKTVDERTAEYHKNLSMTAHVLISLAEAKGVTGFARVEMDKAVKKAMSYLEDNIHECQDVFVTAITAQALTLSKSNRRNDMFYTLSKMNTTSQFVYWANKPIPQNPTKNVVNVPFMWPRIIYPNEAYAVQSTSYALMVYLNNNYLSDSVPIMKWLQTMRNSIGGFGGTRDTLVALQALTEYAKRDTNRDLYNMQINLQSTSSPRWKVPVKLDKKNWVDTQLIDIPVVWGQLKAVAQGTGIALMQLHTKVNVEWPQMIAPAPRDHFYDVYLDQRYAHGKNFSIIDYTSCVKWRRPDMYDQTGLTVMEVEVPTGYVAVNDVLREYVQSGEVPNLGRAEYKNNRLFFYIDYVEAKRPTCVQFRVNRWYPVSNMTIQQELKAYDYYEPGLYNNTLYTTSELFNLHICQVCGSFQCPYCPYYNTSPTLSTWSPVALLTLHIVYYLSRLLQR